MTHIYHDANFINNIADKDNPLIDRFSQDEWQSMRKLYATGGIQPTFFTQSLFQVPNKVISFTRYDIADFSDIRMIDDVVETPQQPNIVETIPVAQTLATAQPLSQSVNNPPPIHHEQKTNEIPNEPVKKPKTQSLSKSEQRQLAKQNKQKLAEQLAEKQAEEERLRQEKIAYALANPTLHEGLLNQRKSMIDNKQDIKDIFSELEQDLQTTILPDQFGENVKKTYEQAIAILQNPQHTSQTAKALMIVEKLANAGASDAMLHQALWRLRGREDLGIVKDERQGLAWVEKSANLQDNRAEKLLSKLYFSGEIVGIDSEKARYWLEQSAEHGHIEAQKLQQGLITAHILQQNRIEEDDYLKKFGLGVVAMIIFMLAVIFLVKI